MPLRDRHGPAWEIGASEDRVFVGRESSSDQPSCQSVESGTVKEWSFCGGTQKGKKKQRARFEGTCGYVPLARIPDGQSGGL